MADFDAEREARELLATWALLGSERKHRPQLVALLERSYRAGRESMREENENLLDALYTLSTWSSDCHEHDEDMGHEPRDLDEEMVRAMESFAGRFALPFGGERG